MMLLKISFVLLLCTKLNQLILILHFIIVIVVGFFYFMYCVILLICGIVLFCIMQPLECPCETLSIISTITQNIFG